MSLDGSFVHPRGWFVVAFSDELAPGAVRPMRYFGRSYVLFRTERGEAAVLDAHCPHLGAHLGVGGRVEGDSVVCPFHAWRFDRTGACTAIPYASKIPKLARVASHPVVERDGMIFLWHDEEGNAPDWQVDPIEGFDGGEWLPWNHSCLTVATQPREIIENVADRAHFMPVHGTDIHQFENVFDGHRATQLVQATAYPLGGGTDRFRGSATYHGPGFMVSRMWGRLESLVINAHVPIDERTLDLRFAVSLRIRADDRGRTAAFAQAYVDNLRRGFLQDVAIWEHKVWRETPALVADDGPIGRARRWYRQFTRPLAEAGQNP